MERHTAALALLLTLCAALPALADQEEEQERAEVRAKMDKDKLQRLRGWSRIVFYCSPPVKTNAKEMFARVCEMSETNVKFLAATSKANVEVLQTAEEFGFQAAFRGMLELRVDLANVGCSAGDPCAVHAQVEARFSYEEAIDQAARSYPVESHKRGGPTDSPASIPRPIEATMWGPKSAMAVGQAGEQLATAVANAIDQILKTFFTDYVRANR